MKVSWIFFILLALGGIGLNYRFLGIAWWTFSGILIAALLAAYIFLHIAKKVALGKKSLNEDSFIFTEGLANKMKNVSLGIQYESSVVAITLLILGIIAFDVYVVFISGFSTVMKVFMVFNSLCGVILMSSMLVTNFQQLMAYRESVKAINTFAASKKNQVVTYDEASDEDYVNPLKGGKA